MICGKSVRRGRVIALLAAVTVGLGLSSAGAANADTFMRQPNSVITRTLGDGTVVHMSLLNQSAKVNPSMGATPLHRNVWGSARVVVDVSGPGASSASIQLNPGYVVGCQVDISSLGTDESESETTTPGSNPAVAPSIGTTETLTVAPGHAVTKYLLDIEQPDDYGNEIHKSHPTVNGPHASVGWNDETFAVNGCAGYAQARAFTFADVSTKSGESIISVWGAPFSMG